MSESTANRQLADTARSERMDPINDPLEQTQRMTLGARFWRSSEAALQSYEAKRK
jgi:hypothetical protein